MCLVVPGESDGAHAPVGVQVAALEVQLRVMESATAQHGDRSIGLSQMAATQYFQNSGPDHHKKASSNTVDCSL
jgi:hypothetical protein